MGRDSSRSGETGDAEAGSTADATETTRAAPSVGPSESLLEEAETSGPSDSPGPSVRGQASPAQYERYYGVEIDAPGEVARLQRLEESNTLQQVREWADEGMPVAAMGRIPQMEAFRERKGTPVPWDVEQRNEESKRRNTSPIQRAKRGSPAGGTDTPESVREVLSSQGQSLDASIQRAMEDRMGDSLGDVRIHTGPKAVKACEDIDARAFTVGNHIAFNRGEYDPSSTEGQHVLAHELAHVRQQTGGVLSMLPQEDVDLEIDPDPALEREAEATAEQVVSGDGIDPESLSGTGVHVQRVEGTQSSFDTFSSGGDRSPDHPVKNRSATFGSASSSDYKKNFFAAYPWLEGQVVVHHAVERQVQKRYPGLISDSELHSLENLRGIPKRINADVHLSAIRKEWNRFYRNNPNPTKQELLDRATEIDNEYGHQFTPPVRE